MLGLTFLFAASIAITVDSAVLVDNRDVTGDLSKFVNYTGILEEDRKHTLESLTSEEENDVETIMEPQFERPSVPHSTMSYSTRDGRVVTQTAASLGQFPYYVLLTITTRTGSTVNCGGSLLSDAWAITAAQCVYSAATIKVDGGLIDTTATALATSSGLAVIHPGFKLNYKIHDIALVKLLSPFTLSSNVYPIKLIKKDYKPSEITIRTMGFGPATSAGTGIGTALNYVDLVHISKATCLQQTTDIYVEYPHNTNCLSSSSNTKGFCIVLK